MRLVRRNLTVHECRECSHRIAFHSPDSLPRAGVDYHAQYDEGAFLSSLEGTRRRQAPILARAIRELAGPDARILDYGSGRGWFLAACREAGFREIAGADTSELAVRLLAEQGITGVRLEGGVKPALPFAPEVVTFLDVIEHFPTDNLSEALGEIVGRLGPSVKLVVIKVPDAAGLLCRTARTLARLGVGGPLEQLYQVGTSPPHHHYFTRRSMRKLAASRGWAITRELADLDFEPARLYQRIHSLSRLPKAIGAVPGLAAGLVARSLGMSDTAIYFLTPP